MKFIERHFGVGLRVYGFCGVLVEHFLFCFFALCRLRFYGDGFLGRLSKDMAIDLHWIWRVAHPFGIDLCSR